jgi:hypothetical protein
MANKNTTWTEEDLKNKGFNLQGDKATRLSIGKTEEELFGRTAILDSFKPVGTLSFSKGEGRGVMELIKPNKKVKNATKVIDEDGTKHDSKLEKYCHDQLITHNIPFLPQHKFILQPPFRYQGWGIVHVTWRCDFYLPEYNLVVDTKGQRSQSFNIKLKMLQFIHRDAPLHIVLPKNKGEVNALVALLSAHLTNPKGVGEAIDELFGKKRKTKKK